MGCSIMQAESNQISIKVQLQIKGFDLNKKIPKISLREHNIHQPTFRVKQK